MSGVVLGMTKAQVRARLGRPVGSGDGRFYYARVWVGFRLGRVVEVTTTRSTERTAGGLGVDSSEADVRRAYPRGGVRPLRGLSPMQARGWQAGDTRNGFHARARTRAAGLGAAPSARANASWSRLRAGSMLEPTRPALLSAVFLAALLLALPTGLRTPLRSVPRPELRWPGERRADFLQVSERPRRRPRHGRDLQRHDPRPLDRAQLSLGATRRGCP